MLHLMRKHAQSWLIKLTLGAIVIVFVFWGVGSYRAQKGNRIALVNGAPIVLDEYRGLYEQMIRTYRKQFGNALDEKLLQSLNIKEHALNELIDLQLLVQEAARLNFQVTDDELFRAIEQIPAFQRDGHFDSQLYERILKRNQMTPEMYEENKKVELLVDKFQGFILRRIKVSDAEALDAYRWLEDKVNIDFVVFKPSTYSSVAVNPEEVETYFSKHKETYKLPPLVKVRYVRIDFKGVEALPATSEDAAKILAFDRAEQVYEACYGTGNISDADMTHQFKVHETNFFPITGPINGIKDWKRFAETAFALSENEVGEPLKLSDGYYILQLVAREPSRIPELALVAERVSQDLIKTKQDDLAKKEAGAFLNDLKSGVEIQTAATNRMLQAEETDFFGRFGEIPKIGSEPDIQETAFLLSRPKPVPDAVVKGKQGYYVFRFKSRQEADVDGFEDKKPQITSSLLLAKRQGAIGELLAGLREKSEITIQEGFLD